MQSVTESIQNRRSIRRYVQEPIPRSDLEDILRLASLAPSAWNVQPWRFIVLTDPDKKSQLEEAANNQKQVGNAPAVIVVFSDMEDAIAAPQEFAHPHMSEEQKARLIKTIQKIFGPQDMAQRGQWGVGQTYICLGFLLLAAQEKGYNTSPMLGFNPKKVRTLFQLPDHVQIAALVALGKGTEKGRPHRHPLERIATFV